MNQLILRLTNSPYGDINKGSVLSASELDSNFVTLKGEVIYTAESSTGLVTLKKINGETFSFAVSDTYITGGTYDSNTGTATFTDNTGGTVSVSGFSTGLKINVTPIEDGETGKVLFQNSDGKLGQSSNLHWESTNNRLSIAQGSNPGARLDVRAQGTLSTDNIFRVRNNGDTSDLLSINGMGQIRQIVNSDISQTHFNSTAIGQSSTGYGVGTSVGLRSVGLGYGVDVSGIDGVGVGYNLNITSAGASAIAFGYNITGRGLSFGREITNLNGLSIGTNLYKLGDGNYTHHFGHNLIDTASYDNNLNYHTFGWGSFVTQQRPDLTYRSNGLNQLLLGYYTLDSEYSNDNGTNWVGIKNGTAPTGQVNGIQIYSNNRNGIVGKASMHVRCEDGTVNVIGDLSGFGLTNPKSVVDIKNKGALSTDLGFRIGNSTNTVDLFKVDGLGRVVIDDNSYSYDNTPILELKGNDYSYGNKNILRFSYGNSERFDIVQYFKSGYNHTSFIIGGNGSGTLNQNVGIDILGNNIDRRAQLVSRGNIVLGNYSSFADFSNLSNSTGSLIMQNVLVEPTISLSGATHIYSKNYNGNAVPHFRTETGDVINLAKETTGITTSTYVHIGGNAVSTNDTFDGYTIGQVIKALRNRGLLS